MLVKSCAGVHHTFVVSRVRRLAVCSDGVAGDDFVMVEWTAEVGRHWIAPLHVHHADDEAWYVLDGELGFRLGEDEVIAAAGCAVGAPRGTPHTYWNAGESEARYILVMTPKLARLIEALHAPDADVPALSRRTIGTPPIRVARSPSPACGNDARAAVARGGRHLSDPLHPVRAALSAPVFANDACAASPHPRLRADVCCDRGATCDAGAEG